MDMSSCVTVSCCCCYRRWTLTSFFFFVFRFPFFQREPRSQLSGGFLELTPLFYHPKLPICNLRIDGAGGGEGGALWWSW